MLSDPRNLYFSFSKVLPVLRASSIFCDIYEHPSSVTTVTIIVRRTHIIRRRRSAYSKRRVCVCVCVRNMPQRCVHCTFVWKEMYVFGEYVLYYNIYIYIYIKYIRAHGTEITSRTRRVVQRVSAIMGEEKKIEEKTHNNSGV